MRSTRNIFRLSTCHHRRGFTLMEVALAITIIGVGILSMVKLTAACTQENALAKQMTTGMLLADHLQEAMTGMPFNDPFLVNTYFGPEPGETLATFNDVDDFDGSNLNPPIDSLRQRMPQFSQYSQVVSVWPVLPGQLNGNTNPALPAIAKGTYTGAVRVVVIITYKRIPTDLPVEVYRTSWIRMDR
jgi:prepilin-type N-terminal cleavage/methylation domain-containing protein